MEDYTKRVDEYLDKLLPKEGYSLIKTEFVKEDGNYYLRAYIDLIREDEEPCGFEKQETEAKPEAECHQEDGQAEADQDGETSDGERREISINDCVKVSRKLSKWLDKEDFIKEAYTLEVCSRGFLKDQAESRE